jgi:hypothetical protein
MGGFKSGADVSLRQDLPSNSAISKLMTLTKNSFSVLSKVENSLKMETAMACKYTLAQYNSVHQYGLNCKVEIRYAMLKAIDYMLSYFSDSVHKMNVSQSLMLVNNLLTDFYYIKLEEVIFVLKEGRNGKWGKIYNRVDADIVYNWFREYAKERIEMAEQMSYREHHNNKATKLTIDEEKMVELYKQERIKKLGA